ACRCATADRPVRHRALSRRSAPPSTRGDAAAVGQGFDWVLLERRAPAPIGFAFAPASRSETRVLTSALIFAIGSGLSIGKRRVDLSVRYCSSPCASPAGYTAM